MIGMVELLTDLLHVQGDVHPEEVLLLSGLLPGEASWRFLLSH